MYNEIIVLVAEKRLINEYGDAEIQTNEREVFAELKSIGQSEFYQAQSTGLKPEIKFIIPDYLEYHNEKKIKYQAFNEDAEEEYTVIRTYRNGNSLEIVCKRGVEE